MSREKQRPRPMTEAALGGFLQHMIPTCVQNFAWTFERGAKL